MNDDALGTFTVAHEETVPADLWAGLISDRLARIPSSLNDLVSVYRRSKEDLGWLAHPNERHAWNFLLKWLDDPHPDMHVPRMSADGGSPDLAIPLTPDLQRRERHEPTRMSEKWGSGR
jgi:hypothetical protein